MASTRDLNWEWDTPFNIISMKHMTDHFRVTSDSEKERALLAHLRDSLGIAAIDADALEKDLQNRRV